MNPAEFANIARSEETLWWFRGMRRILFSLLDPLARARKFDRVLEAGCGTGYLSKSLAERYGWTIFPADLSHEALLYAKSMRVDRPVRCDIARMPYPDSSFDALLSMDVLVHFERGREIDAMRELARVLRPGGLAVIRLAAFDLLRSRHSDFVGEKQRYSRSRVARGLTLAGFQMIRATYANTLLLPVALAKFRVWEPLMQTPPHTGVEPVAPWLDRLLYAPLSIESALVGAGVNLPVGQSIITIAEKR